MLSIAMLSTGNDDWCTPDALFKELNQEFNFDMDAAATDENAKCVVYYTKEDDSLKHDWFGVVWLNPPYSRGLQSAFIKKKHINVLCWVLQLCV